MMVDVACRVCWYDFTVWNEEGGGEIRCPNCGARVFPEIDHPISRVDVIDFRAAADSDHLTPEHSSAVHTHL